MTLWMLWSILFATTVGIAAVAIERAAGGFGAPRRHIWMAALIVAAFLPALLALRRVEITSEVTAEPAVVETPIDEAVGPIASSNPAVVPPVVAQAAAAPRLRVTAADIDRVAVLLWIASSLILALAFGRSMLRLHQKRRAWIDATVSDQHVLVSTEDGPAVVGFAHPSIVVPEWALSLDRQVQEMMLRHETEHIRAGDPRALLAAGIILVALPWNAGLWWLVRRLRMAMELDCDARVIRSVGASHKYGLMLLAVGERHATVFPLASSLASPRPLLERRIDAMSLPRPRRPLRAALPFVAIALIATTAATRAPRPASLRAAVIKVQQATAAVPVIPAVQVQPVEPAAAPMKAKQVKVEQVTTRTPLHTATSQKVTMPLVVMPILMTPQQAAQAPAPRSNPDRAKIAELAKQHQPAVIRGDTAAQYIVMVFDATDKYIWSTSGSGNVSLEIAGDTRSPMERSAFNREHRAELVGATRAGGGGGRGGGAGAALVFPIISDSLIARYNASAIGLRDTLSARLTGGGRARGGAGDTTRPDSLWNYRMAYARGGTLTRVDSNGVARTDTARLVYRRPGDSLPIPLGFVSRGGSAGGGVARGGGGGGAVGAARGGGGGGRGGGGVADTTRGATYTFGWVSTLNSTINQASGFQEPRPGESGIQGLLSKSVAAAEMYTFAPAELAPQMLRVMVVHLTPGTVWKGR